MINEVIEMKNILYLFEFKVSGIKNIEKEISLNFYKKTLSKQNNTDKYKIKAIYGENGSGKTAIITAVNILKNIIIEGNYLGNPYNQKLLRELVNKKTNSLDLEASFLDKTNNIIYTFKIELVSQNDFFEIAHEKFSVKPGAYNNDIYRIIYETKNGKLIKVDCINSNKEIIFENTFNLLKTQSFISIFPKYADEKILDDKTFVVDILSIIIFSLMINVYLDEEDQHELYFLSNFIKEASHNISEKFNLEDFEYFNSVSSNKIEKENFSYYKEKINMLCDFVRIFKKNLKSIDIEKKEDGQFYICSLNMNYGDYKINKEFESTGIKKLIRLFDCFNDISNGGIVFIDEMDSNINGVYLCKLLEYFMSYCEGQLCFTTHNIDPMSVLKKNRNSICFLSIDNTLKTWKINGNYSPEKSYKKGMIEDLPFNIEAEDFIGILGDE